MKLFQCPTCSQRLYFENVQCLNCGSLVSYDPDQGSFVLTGVGSAFRCLNATECSCNWVAPEGGFCRACTLNQTIPDLSIDGNRERWIRVEAAKKRAIYSLLTYGLPVFPKSTPDDVEGLAFDFLASTPGDGPGGEHILTGHDNGLITLNVAEADSAEREKLRTEMGEPYRTLLGHFRHELGHYYWDRLIKDDAEWLEKFRAMFGDETEDYAQALQRHYAEGPQPGWQDSFISAYATSHPWEDWAETWAHYIHITDTLEMVAALNFPLGSLDTVDNAGTEVTDQEQPAIEAAPEAPSGPFAPILARWLVLSEASNAINRCMGLPDLYPFVISPRIAEKLDFVHRLVAAKGGIAAPQPQAMQPAA